MAAYDRFWDIHLTADNGYYDFSEEIDLCRAYQVRKGTRNWGSLVLINPPAPGPLDEPIVQPREIREELPQTGYIASAVRFPDITNTKVKKDFQRLVQWINDPNHIGKVRFHAHGKPGGEVLMYTDDARDSYNEVRASKLVDWLRENGLNHDNLAHTGRLLRRKVNLGFGGIGGLVTICLDFCYAGRNGGNQVKSAIDQVVGALTDAKLHGIKVTGSSDSVGTRPTNEFIQRNRTNALAWNTPITGQFRGKTLDQCRGIVADWVAKLPDEASERFERDGRLFKLATMDLNPLTQLAREMEKELVEEEWDRRYPANTTPGQWGRIVKVGGNRERWSRIRDGDGKFARVSGE